MKKILFFSLFAVFLPPFAAEAEEVSEALAARAAKAWVDRGLALGKIPASKTVAAVRTLVDPETGAEMRVVSFQGGGWVVTSADDRIDPVLAFSETGEGVDPDERNPFWALLRADIAAREEAAGVGRAAAGRKDGGAAPGTEAARRRWTGLLDGAAAKDGPKPLDSLSDLRVDALVRSKWSQDEAGGKNCWNYYTPNNYVCGCVATALSQLMRFWQQPAGYVTPHSYDCSVDGVSGTYTMKGGYYSWSNMPLEPSYSNVPTDTQCAAIGKLAYDVGVSVEMGWAPGGSSASIFAGMPALTEDFGYSSAVAIRYSSSTCPWSLETFKNDVCPNFDAGCPIGMSIPGHAVVADGYGFSDGDFYIHVNYGWSGSGNAWYCPPNMSAGGYVFNGINGILCNIFPDRTGNLLSGRVLDSNGSPVPGATVSLSDGQSTTTDAKGIYAFHADEGSYTVSASKNGASGRVSATVGSTKPLSVDGHSSYYYISECWMGNSWGNDIALSGTPGPSAPAAPSWVEASDGAYADKVFVEWGASAGATSYTVYRSASYSGTKTSLGLTASTSWNDTTATAETTYYYWVKASNSAGTSAFGPYDSGYRAAAPTRPGNDDFASAYSISGSSGSTSGSNVNATRQTGEPAHAGQSESLSVWWRWTAPGNGTAVFDTNGSSFDTVLAIYTGSSVSSLSGIASDDDGGSGNNASRCSFAVTSGTTYRIAVGGYSSNTGSIALNWSFAAAASTPSAPSWVDASDGRDDCVYIEWGGSTGATSYDVYRATSASGSKTWIGSTESTCWYDYDAAAGTTYYYRITASNGAGTSGYSDYDTGYRAAAPSRPGNDDFASAYALSGSSGSTSGTSVGATRQTDEPEHYGRTTGSVWWRWTAPGSGTAVFDTDGSDFDTVMAVYTGSTLSSLAEIVSDDDGGSANNSSRCSFSVTSGTTYRIAVAGWSSTGSIALNWSWQSASSTPSPPSWVSASDGWDGYDCVYVEWGSSTGATYYEVYRATSSYGSKSYIGWTDSTCYYDYDAELGTTYYYWIVAANDYGTSGYSDWDSGYRAAPETAPDAPSWVSASDGDYTTKVRVEWDSSSGATSYEIFRATSYSGSKTSIGTTSSTYWNDTTATAGTTYYYWIKASNGAGTSGFSGYDTGWRASGGSSSGGKYALCVGINRYSSSYGAGSLSGCVNDAKYFRNNLVGLGGWESGNTTLLTDDGATKSAIRAAMADYASRAVAGDEFVYVHSSHGGQDYGTSVYLCAHDADYADTELAADLARFRSGVKVVVIVDACHSGGLFKGRDAGGRNARFDLAGRVTALLDETREKERKSGARGVGAKISSSEIGWVTAADYNQYSYDGGSYEDGGSSPGGVFLTAFTRGWWSGEADAGYDGDDDGFFDAYEGWSYAYGVCVSYDDDFTPQYLNESVLRSVELGECDRPPAPGRPGNDDFANAYVLSGSSGTTEGSNSGATTETDEWADNYSAEGSVWWEWTAPSTGIVRFSTEGSDFDTILSVYEGDDYDWMWAVATDDDCGEGGTSVVSFRATAGTTYRIAVYGYDSDRGDIRLSWQGGLAAVYRFYSRNYRGHFFTIDEDEMWTLRLTNPNWRYEGVAYLAHPSRAEGTTPVYRFYSKNYRGHFFTINADEMRTIRRTNPNWKYEGIAFYVYPDSSRGGDPVYRFWSKGYRHHFFTTDEDEMWDIRYSNPNWKYEGVAYYAASAGAWSEDYLAGAAARGVAPAASGKANRRTLLTAAREAASSAEKGARSDGAPARTSAAGGSARGASGATPGTAAPAAAPALRAILPGAPAGVAVAIPGVTDIGVALVETRTDPPSAEELASPDSASPSSGTVSFRLALPAGARTAALWSAAEGPVAAEDIEGGSLEFEIPASGVWHWLRVRDAGGAEAFSLWLCAE